MIILNVLQLMLYSDPIEPATLGLYEFLNYFFVLFFAIEAIIRIVALSFKEYMRSAWNAFRFFLRYLASLPRLQPFSLSLFSKLTSIQSLECDGCAAFVLAHRTPRY